jgi:hypothetical protein
MTASGEPDIEGPIVIEWRTGTHSGITSECLAGIYDATTGDLITTATHADIVVHAGIYRRITADLTLFTDEAGNPIFNADTWPSGAYIKPDGEMATDVFTFLVTGMRVRDVQQRKSLPQAAGLRHHRVRRYRDRDLECFLERRAPLLRGLRALEQHREADPGRVHVQVPEPAASGSPAHHGAPRSRERVDPGCGRGIMTPPDDGTREEILAKIAELIVRLGHKPDLAGELASLREEIASLRRQISGRNHGCCHHTCWHYYPNTTGTWIGGGSGSYTISTGGTGGAIT